MHQMDCFLSSQYFFTSITTPELHTISSTPVANYRPPTVSPPSPRKPLVVDDFRQDRTSSHAPSWLPRPPTHMFLFPKKEDLALSSQRSPPPKHPSTSLFPKMQTSAAARDFHFVDLKLLSLVQPPRRVERALGWLSHRGVTSFRHIHPPPPLEG